MTVISLTNCPPKLRGDLTKWLCEINVGVYVGAVSARVRDALWQRICDSLKNGRATMVFGANNEQGMDFRVHNATWEPIDFDGLKLVLCPSPGRLAERSSKSPPGMSNAAKQQAAKRFRTKQPCEAADAYVVVDVETTGLSVETCEIIELAAMLVEGREIQKQMHMLVKPDQPIPAPIEKLTGITNEMVQTEGCGLKAAMEQFLQLCSTHLIISHNAAFDYAFLRAACARCRLPLLSNPCTDTLALAKRRVKHASNYKLTTLAKHFSLDGSAAHRAMADCLLTWQLYEKLKEMG